MPYDRRQSAGGAAAFGLGGGAPIDLSSADFTVPDTVKAIVVVAAGNVVCTPVNGSSVTITGAPVGMLLPWHCSQITKVGTTATLATVLG